MRVFRSGQAITEYAVILVIVVAALITMQTYIKRGVQGRWKESVDGMGEQYDPGMMNGVVVHSTQSNSETRIQAVAATSESGPGYYTMRTDMSSSRESTNGSVQIGY